MANVDICTEQEGICISKEYRAAKEARKDLSGRDWPATEEKFIVKVVSGTARHFSEESGIAKPLMLEYEVDRETFQKVVFKNGIYQKAKVGFNVRTFGSDTQCKPEYFELLTK